MLRTALVLACVLLGLVMAPAALAASTTQILRDCADDGRLQGDYSPSELRKARQDIPTDTDQYTDCRDVLARAAARGVSGSGSRGRGGGDGSDGGAGGGGGGGNGELLMSSTDADRRSLADALRGRTDPLDVGGTPIVPGASRFAAGAVRNEIPASLLVPLILLGVAVLAAGGHVARRYVLRRR
jgi:hypothetical protein